jgi:hypothetical protein
MNGSDSQAFLCFILSTVEAENAVSQRYVAEKHRRNRTAISCKLGHSVFILILNFELLIQLQAVSSPLSITIQQVEWFLLYTYCATDAPCAFYKQYFRRGITPNSVKLPN